MGCDIHLFGEYKPKDEKTFQVFCEDLQGERCYELFDLLAGAAGEGKPLIPPRGLPQCVSWFTSDKYNDPGREWHSVSWLTIQELKNCLENCSEKSLAVFEGLLGAMERLDGLGYETRIVFWFDS